MELHFRQNSIFVFDTRLAVFYATLHNATSNCLGFVVKLFDCTWYFLFFAFNITNLAYQIDDFSAALTRKVNYASFDFRCCVFNRESWKHWPPLRGLPTDPRSTDYPTDYSTDYPKDYPYGLPLKIDQIPFFGVEKYKNWSIPAPPTRWDLKQPPFSFRTCWSSLFHFRPILHQPPSKTLFPQWRIGKRYWIFIFFSCLNCLSQPFVQS